MLFSGLAPVFASLEYEEQAINPTAVLPLRMISFMILNFTFMLLNQGSHRVYISRC